MASSALSSSLGLHTRHWKALALLAVGQPPSISLPPPPSMRAENLDTSDTLTDEERMAGPLFAREFLGTSLRML